MRTARATVVAALTACAVTGCSFVGVSGPADRVALPPANPADMKCQEDSIFPSLDALGGAFGMAAAVGGVFAEQLSDDGEPEGFTKYYAGPLALVSIIYLVSAGYGNRRITWCSDAKDRIRSGNRF